jgi:hypothetical protein
MVKISNPLILSQQKSLVKPNAYINIVYFSTASTFLSLTRDKGAASLYNLLNSIDNRQLFESDCATRPLIDKMVAQRRNTVEILQ